MTNKTFKKTKVFLSFFVAALIVLTTVNPITSYAFIIRKGGGGKGGGSKPSSSSSSRPSSRPKVDLEKVGEKLWSGDIKGAMSELTGNGGSSGGSSSGSSSKDNNESGEGSSKQNKGDNSTRSGYINNSDFANGSGILTFTGDAAINVLMANKSGLGQNLDANTQHITNADYIREQLLKGEGRIRIIQKGSMHDHGSAYNKNDGTYSASSISGETLSGHIIVFENTVEKEERERRPGSIGNPDPIKEDPDQPHNTIRRDHDPIGKTRIIETDNPSTSSSDKSNPDPPKDPDPPKIDPPKPPTPPPYPGDKITIHPPSGCPNYLTWTETTYEYVESSNSWRPVNHSYKVEFTTDVTLEDAKNNDLKASKTLKAGYGIKVGTNTTYEVKQTSGPSKSPSLNLNIQPPADGDVTVTTSWNMTHIYKEQPSVVKLEGSGFIFKTPVNPLSKNNSDVIYTDRDMRDGSHTVKVDVKNISVAGYNLCTVNDETFRIKGDMYEDYKVD